MVMATDKKEERAVVDITQYKKFTGELMLKDVISRNYMRQIQNYFGDEKKALRFLSGVTAAVQRNRELLECQPVSVINSFMIMAQLELMPSDVSGEAYVLPYNNNRKVDGKWVKIKEAQFQLGYQGLVTLFYRAGCKEIIAEIVRKGDTFTYVNGVVHHEVDPFSDERGEAIGAYVIAKLSTGGQVSKVMSKKEIMAIAEKFSKSFKSDHTPWDEANDPQLWMWKKTVLKQVAKLVPKNERIVQAIAEDNRDSVIQDRLEAAKADSEALQMGNLLKSNDKENNSEAEAPQEHPDYASENQAAAAEGAESAAGENIN